MNYYERHIGDYLKDTAHLSLLEHGVYTRLLDVYYTREGPIPAADAARLIGARTREEKAALATVLAEFFVPVDGHHAQDRCDREIARFQDKRGKAKASAEVRWSAQRSQSDGNANASTDPPADAMRTDMRSHDERNATREHAGARPPARPQSPVTSNQGFNTATSNEVARRPAGDQPALALVEASKPKGPPDCPHTEVLALWAEVLPSMPQHLPSQWKGARADHLRTRWRETAQEKGWTDAAQGLAYLRKFFAYVAQSRFLTGRVSSRDPDKPPFTVTLAWLVKPENWAKTHEGNYHQDAA